MITNYELQEILLSFKTSIFLAFLSNLIGVTKKESPISVKIRFEIYEYSIFFSPLYPRKKSMAPMDFFP